MLDEGLICRLDVGEAFTKEIKVKRMVLLAATAGLLALPQPSFTQQLPRALESYRIGDNMKILTVNRGLHIGEVLRIGPDSVYLEPERGSHQVEIAAIERLWHRGNAAGTGAIAGGITAGLLATGFAALMTSAVGEGPVDGEITFKFGLYCGIGGALLGAGIGSLFGEWHSVFP